MSKRRKVPEDLMGTILGGGAASSGGVSGDERTSPEAPASQAADRSPAPPASAGENSISWEAHPERTGITFNLSKQVSRELDRLRLELQTEEGLRSSNSELAELALRIAIEDVRKRGRESELLRSLSHEEEPEDGRSGAATAGPGTPAETAARPDRTVQRSVTASGYIVETTYDERREVVDEDVVGNVADLPVEEEYLDQEGRLLSLARDELGNTFERITDDESNTLGARIVRNAEQGYE